VKPADSDFQQRLGSIATLLAKIESAADPSVRATARELVQLLMELHGAGIERMLEIVDGSGEEGRRIIDRLGSDDLVSSLLVLYGLHPLDLETRVIEAVGKVSAQLKSRGGQVELLSVQDGAVRVRLEANGQGCGSTPDALKAAVEEAIYAAAPDLASLSIDIPGQASSLIPLEMLRSARPLSHTAMQSTPALPNRDRLGAVEPNWAAEKGAP
jgi:Fe-S cluster biogenesis protein NfuA